MRKLKHIINWTIWSLLALYAAAMILIQLPFMQRWIGSLIANALGDKLGTEVRIGHVDLGLFNRIIVDDVVICDQQAAEMLKARRMSVKMDLLPLFDGRVSISSAQLFGTDVRLYRDSANALPNYQFVLEALASKEKDKPSTLDLHIGSVIVRQLSVSYDQRDAPETPGRLNPKHLKIADVSAHVLLRKLTADTLNLNVKRISMREQRSGLNLQQLAFKLEAGRSNAELSDFKLLTMKSALIIDSLVASYDIDHLPSSLAYSTNLAKAHVVLDELAPLLPEGSLPHYTLDLQLACSGTAEHIRCPRLTLSTPDEQLLLQASGTYAKDAWALHVDRLQASEQLIADCRELTDDVPELITRLGNVSLEGQMTKDEDGHLTAQATVRTALGQVAAQGTMDQQERQWNAQIGTDSLDLRRLTGHADLGLMAADLVLAGKQDAVSLKGTLPRLDYKNYQYKHLDIDGVYTPSEISGNVTVNDANLQANVEGFFRQGQPKPNLRIMGDIATFVPQALHLSDRWGEAVFAGVVNADITGLTPDNAEGTLDLNNFSMAQGEDYQYYIENLHIQTRKEADERFLLMNSDFGEGQLSGRFNWNTLAQSFTAVMPSLFPERKPADNDFNLSLRLTDSEWLEKLVGVDLDMKGPLNLIAQVTDSIGRIDLDADIPSFSYGSNNFQNAALHLKTAADSTRMDLSAVSLSDKGKATNMQLSALAHGDELNSLLKLETDHSGGGTINTITRLYKNDEGKREAHVRVMPSQLVLKDMVWDLEPCDILYSENRLMVDQFTLHHGKEHLIIDGIASRNATDSLVLDLRGVDVASVLDLVNFRSVSFGGKASGNVYVCHAFNKPDAWADLTVEDFLFQQARMGTLEAHALWNADDGQIDLDAAIDDGAEEQTYIDGYISPKRSELDLGIRARGTTISFIQSFTKSFISSIEGHVYGDVRVFGHLKRIDLSGEALVTGQASVKPLGTTYTFQENTVTLGDGDISFSDFRFSDRDQHEGLLNGSIHHQYLKNFTFDLRADADNLLVYDFPFTDYGASIGGTVWATGEAVLRGRPGEVVIDCDATPAPSSVFVYNAANPDAINRQQFITWGDASATASSPQPSGSATAATQPHNQQGSDLRLNLRINATPDATLRLLMDQNSGDYITLNGDGVMRASYYNKGPFQMFGTYNVERGTYSMTIQNIIKKNFSFQPGSTLVFGGDPMQAALNLKASHTVNGVSLSDLGLGNSFTSNTIRVNCLMNILGTAGSPRVEFDLEMPTVNSEEQQMIRSIISSEQELNQQVVYLLGIGRFYTQGANNATTQAYGQTELAMQSLLSGTVSSQINQLLSQVIKNDDWNFGANISTGNEGWHNAEYEGLISGRMLNNRLLINGQFGYRDNATQANPSFIGDFDISYLLTPGGSLALKAYNQTNDRYFTHSSLNTQGIGIIMKKDFNGLSDLFTHKRKKARKAK